MANLTELYNFLTSSKYTYDSNKIVLNPAKLKLQQADVDFTQDFDNDTGFTYDSNLAEFTGGLVRQKDKRPANATVYASFSTNEDSDWGGSLNNTLIGGATWDNGMIDLTGKSGKRLNQPATGGNFDAVGTVGCIRFDYKPDYTIPTGTIQILEYDTPVGNNNAIFITHSGSTLSVDLRDSSGVAHWMYGTGVNFIQGNTYNIEVNFDFDGTSRVFVDGVPKGNLNTSAWTRSAAGGTFEWGGASGTGDFWIDNIILFDTVQHTADFSGELPFIYYTTVYVETPVILPEMEHTGDGTIKLFNSFSTIEAGAPRTIIQIGRSGDYLYWNGAAWVVSNETYAQANDTATFNTNCTSLLVDGEEYGQFMIIFPDSNTLSSVAELTANMNVDIGYLQTNPSIKNKNVIEVDSLVSVSLSSTITGSDELRLAIEVDTIEKYWDGSAWSNSSGYSQSNTLTEININLSTLIVDSADIRWILYFHSDDGTTTPIATSLSLTYNFILIIVGTNSWVTLAEANNFLDQMFDSNWSDLAEIVKKQCLITAFWLIYTWPEVQISKTSTDENVKIAQIRLAEWIYNNYSEWKDRGALIASGVKNFTLSKWREAYNSQSLPIEVMNLLNDSLYNSGGYFPVIERELEN